MAMIHLDRHPMHQIANRVNQVTIHSASWLHPVKLRIRSKDLLLILKINKVVIRLQIHNRISIQALGRILLDRNPIESPMSIRLLTIRTIFNRTTIFSCLKIRQFLRIR